MTPRAKKSLTPEQRAEDIVSAWEHFVGETMPDDHRATMEKLIIGQMREVRQEEREALRERLELENWSGSFLVPKLIAWLDARGEK